MKMLFDFFPIIVFFAVFQITSDDPSNTTQAMVYATEAGIAATLLQVSIFWLRHRRFEKMHLITLVLISVFGGITIALEDSFYIKWKTTILEWVFALVFLGSQYFGKKNLVERMMGAAIMAPEHVWRILNYAWVVFFILMGFINLYVIYNFDDETWVNFKTFGMLGMTVVFVILQSIYVTRHAETEFIEQAKPATAEDNEEKNASSVVEQQGKD